jgi:hypothetical protein
MKDFTKTAGNISVPVAIIVAGLIIAGAVMYTNRGNVPNSPSANNNVPADVEGDINALRPVDESDWVNGNRDAKIKIVEYSDTECPFCGRLHDSLKQVVSDYDGQVAWAYRHLPLAQLHSKAPIEAHATECAGELGGNEGFWNYTNLLYETTPANNGLDLALLPKFAEQIGLDVNAFNQCQEEGRHQDKVQEDFDNAVEVVGPRLGTPYSAMTIDGGLNETQVAEVNVIASGINQQAGRTLIYVSDDTTKISLNGAIPLEIWTGIIDIILK